MDRRFMQELSQDGRASHGRGREGFALGAGVALGWALHDVTVLLRTDQPEVMLELVPGWLTAVLLGALAGLVCVRRPVLLAALVGAAALASVLPRALDTRLSLLWMRLPPTVLLAGLALALAGWCQARRPLGALRLGTCAGVLACIAMATYRDQLLPVSRVLALLTAVALGLGFVRQTLLRRLGTVLVLAVPVVWGALKFPRQPRPLLPPPTARATADAPNLLLIVLDTVRADRLSVYGYQRETTPRLDAFARAHATTFLDARSTSSWTLPSHASLLTGLFPAVHGATAPRQGRDARTVRKMWPAQPLRDDVPTLGDVLRGAGYETAAVVSNAYNVGPHVGLHRGFEHFDGRKGAWLNGYLTLPQLAGRRPWVGHRLYRNGRAITDQALGWLDDGRRGGPFFLMLNYMDAHSPFLPPGPWDGLFSDERPRDPHKPTPADLSLLYDRSLAYLDSEVGRFLEGVEERGLLQNTVVIVTSDHGEALGDHGFPGHSWSLYEAMIHVPLLVKPVGPRTATTRSEPITGADVFHLALREVGVETAREPLPDGMVAEWYRGIWDTPAALAVFEEQTGTDLDRDLVAWMEGRVKLIVSSNGVVEAFDLDRDPDERHPLELTEDQVLAAQERARAWWTDHPPPAPVDMPTDAATLDQLRALGY